jgi:hypothetical protein
MVRRTKCAPRSTNVDTPLTVEQFAAVDRDADRAIVVLH